MLSWFKDYLQFFLMLTLFCEGTVYAQKVKEYNLNVDYQAVPPFPLYTNWVPYMFYVKEKFINPANQVEILEISSAGAGDRCGFYKSAMPKDMFQFISKEA